MNETIDHLQQATLRLSQEGSMKDRLTEAYADHLAEIDPCSLPEVLRSEFEALHSAMHSAVPQPRECVIRASVRKMSSTEVRAHAALVVRAFALMARSEQTVMPHRLTRPNPGSPVVSLFAEA